MNGDGKWRTRNVGDGPRPFVIWRIIDGRTEYDRSAACHYAPQGRIVRYGYESAHRKARELNAAPA